MCNGNMAQTTFRWNLCSCTNTSFGAELLTDAYDSTMGPYMPGGLGGGVALDGNFMASSSVDIGGALWTSSTAGVHVDTAGNVRQELHVGGSVSTMDNFAIGASAWIAGNLMAGGNFPIAGTLHIPAASTISGGVMAQQTVREPVNVPVPCDCSPSQLIPVGTIVASHRTSNDNATINLDPNVLAGGGGPQRLDLPCGRYYLTSINTNNSVVIVAHGNTALYVDGDVSSGGDFAVTVDPTGQLDVFIKGRMVSQAVFNLGSPNWPALVRIYVGTGPLNITGGSLMGAFVYEATGLVTPESDLEVFGGIFAGDFNSTSRTVIHYDRGVLNAGGQCPPPGGGGGAGGGPGCSSCRDCGNQACINGSCGSCTSSDQCCAPLVCSNGRCVPLVP
jgi:hypothetical protein